MNTIMERRNIFYTHDSQTLTFRASWNTGTPGWDVHASAKHDFTLKTNEHYTINKDLCKYYMQIHSITYFNICNYYYY